MGEVPVDEVLVPLEGHDVAGMSPSVCAVGVIAAPAGADQDQLERPGVLVGQRPISRIHTIRTPTNSTPINSVSRVIANSGVPGLNVANSPPATSTMKIAQRNAYRPISGDSIAC